MTKILLLLITTLFLTFGGGNADVGIETDDVFAQLSGDMPEPVTLTLTAVGDCTLASDTGAMGKNSFVKMYDSEETDSSYFFASVRHIFENDDLTIVNFEGTLSENGKRQPKTYAFRGKPEYVDILTGSSVEAANLANNHSRDYGDVSYEDTGTILSANGITWFEGENVAIREIKGIKVGLIGANLLEKKGKREFLQNLEYLNSLNPDFVVVNFHWGTEKASKPNSVQKEYAYLAIDNGADLVIGHHPHVLQGVEEYKGKYILYSLANFCFGGNKNPSDKDTAIFRQSFTFIGNDLVESSKPTLIPCSVSSEKKRNTYQPTPLNGEEYDRVKEKIIKRSEDFSGIENVIFARGNTAQ